MTAYDGLVLAGGEARRLGGVDKPSLDVGGRQLRSIAIDALSGAACVVTVGSEVRGGPVAAISAGLASVSAATVVVLAADLPFVTGEAILALVAARGDAVAAIAVDADGVDQPLVACYATAALRTALPAEPSGASMRTVVTSLTHQGLVRRIDLGGEPPAILDCDTAADLQQAREWS